MPRTPTYEKKTVACGSTSGTVTAGSGRWLLRRVRTAVSTTLLMPNGAKGRQLFGCISVTPAMIMMITMPTCEFKRVRPTSAGGILYSNTHLRARQHVVHHGKPAAHA